MLLSLHVVIFTMAFIGLMHGSAAIGDIVWSVNAGGDKHTDVYGITYQKDQNSEGVASDYGKSLIIQRVPKEDQILYQTERYHTNAFGYNIPLKEDGDYVLVLKFCEVWFNAPMQKVFNVQLNGEHDILENVDIFAKVGRGFAHDEIIPFKVQNKHLIVNGQKSPITNGKVELSFLKGDHDNPKINAAYVMKGQPSDVPLLPPIATPVRPEEEEEVEEAQKRYDGPRKSHVSGTKVADPYAGADSSSYVLPIAAAVGSFIPLLYCLCKI